jgi:UDP-N-acetylglucosamine 2-epimerase (non-hydrolysing)
VGLNWGTIVNIAVVVGTRPEIIKMSPIVRELQRRKLDFLLLHTGQHYSFNMDKTFFEQLGLPRPDYNLHSGSGSHAEETARILVGVEKFIEREKPDSLLVEGDTNTVLAGSLAASKCGVTLGHVEAGLRSRDRRMPEETNRIVADHISDVLFSPTRVSRENLVREGIELGRIHVTGNTIVDALKHDLTEIRRSELAVDTPRRGYFLLTLHRQENVDDKGRLRQILEGVSTAGATLGHPVLYPVHPRTKERISQFGFKVSENIKTIPPLGYFQFIRLMKDADLVLTDSGGVQEESCVLRVPCVTIRDSTERPETLEVGCNKLTKADSRSMLKSVKQMMGKAREWPNPFGDGHASERILNILTRIEVRKS